MRRKGLQNLKDGANSEEYGQPVEERPRGECLPQGWSYEHWRAFPATVRETKLLPRVFVQMYL